MLVIGSGIGGLTFALRAAATGDVLVVTKKHSLESNTNYAQGGIAAVIGASDSFDRHFRDTIRTGAGLCHASRVRVLVERGPSAVADLIEWGVKFSERNGALSLGIEGGHSAPRIVHSEDRTGVAIETALLSAVAAHPRIQLLEDHLALRLEVADRRCVGAVVLDLRSSKPLRVAARVTTLASGGCATVYRHTTNPAIATGDGVAMAFAAGAAVANLEFIQFHPTALYPAEEHAFLISEALRGEGAVLRNASGEAFAARYSEKGDLAARDIVARAVHSELKRGEVPYVHLDATGIAAQRLEERFPGILQGCLSRGIDPRAEPIPVVPAAHYQCGGVWTDGAGRTTLDGLYVVGECACTGVHGANRLASNSLLEAVVFAERAAARCAEEIPDMPRYEAGHAPLAPQSVPAAASVAGLRRDLKQVMWEDFGIVRGSDEMQAGASQLRRIRDSWNALPRVSSGHATGADWAESVELLNMLDVAELIARCALWRKESRGLHFVVGLPYKDNERFLRDSLVIPTQAGSDRIR